MQEMWIVVKHQLGFVRSAKPHQVHYTFSKTAIKYKIYVFVCSYLSLYCHCEVKGKLAK